MVVYARVEHISGHSKLSEVAKKVSLVYSMKRYMQMEAHFQSQTCYLCSRPYTSDNGKVMDHDHITGMHRGPAHSKCNILYRTPRFLPVLFHNLGGYDAHFIVRELGRGLTEEENKNMRIDVIPNSEEKYISFAMTVETSKFFPADHLDLVIRKGVYPYDYVDSFEKLRETVLPPKEAFYNQLNEMPVSDEDYQHAQAVWGTFNIRTLAAYSELYLKVDVMLLCDIFENFRDACLGAYSLDPAWYYTAPGLAWDAMLKYTGIQLDLLADYDMVLMIERGIRGGLCQCSHRYGIASNKYLDPDRDPQEESSYISYLDANNLYGWAMSKVLPSGGFEWVKNPESVDFLNLPKDGPFGYIVEADIEYPERLHDLHNDFPLLPENKVPPGGKFKKLWASLDNREKYVLHFINLQQAMSLLLKLVRVHRALLFRQSHWLRSYIELNTKHRQQATNDFDKDFFKLMNNAVFGKFMEDVRKRCKIELVVNQRRLTKLTAKPTFKDRTIYTDSLVAVHSDFEKIEMNKPIYVRMAILDLSKTDDLYNDMTEFMDELDTSDYPNGHPIHRSYNKKVLGKFKDEANRVPVSEFVGLRAKMYSLRIPVNKVIKKAKGIKKSAVENRITFDDYLATLRDGKEFKTTFQVGEVASNYIKKLVNNDIKELDTIYGIVYDGRRFTVGDTVVSIQKDIISVGEVDYYGTPVMRRCADNNKKKKKKLRVIETPKQIGSSAIKLCNEAKRYQRIIPKTRLSNFDLILLAKVHKVRTFRGVFMRDEFPNKPWKNERTIFNLDNSYGKGTHWVCYKKILQLVYYVDSS
ncbi:unnamed protein product [Nezara viridula]|uniref:DNA-directed DNA polymerase n=1 Tax=Nezara viridula TaxID=85310 RepID=A0A9P0E9P2_NEZVI|nr:unnamed protein product [Nezara viridula]